MAPLVVGQVVGEVLRGRLAVAARHRGLVLAGQHLVGSDAAADRVDRADRGAFVEIPDATLEHVDGVAGHGDTSATSST